MMIDGVEMLSCLFEDHRISTPSCVAGRKDTEQYEPQAVHVGTLEAEKAVLLFLFGMELSDASIEWAWSQPQEPKKFLGKRTYKKIPGSFRKARDRFSALPENTEKTE